MLSSPNQIPLIENPGNACALCCYTMVASYFFDDAPDFETMGDLCGWKPGYVVWEFAFFRWFIAQGGQVELWDNMDYRLWASHGFDALRPHLSEGAFEYYSANTHDLNAVAQDIKTCLDSQVMMHKRHPAFEDLKTAMARGCLCTVVLNHAALIGDEGVNMHQMLVLEVTDCHVICHNPLGMGGAQAGQKIERERFIHAWLKTESMGCLHAYSLAN